MYKETPQQQANNIVIAIMDAANKGMTKEEIIRLAKSVTKNFFILTIKDIYPETSLFVGEKNYTIEEYWREVLTHLNNLN